MRVAKQKRSEDLAVRAKQMASNRVTNVYQKIDDQSGKSLTRAIQANKDMHKHQVLSNTELGRRNKFVSKNEREVRLRREPARRNRAPERRVPDRRNANRQVNVDRRRSAPNRDTKTVTRGRHIPEPRENIRQNVNARREPSSKSQLETRYSRTPVEAKRGFTTNPAEEMRRRRKLEAKIRELSDK